MARPCRFYLIFFFETRTRGKSFDQRARSSDRNANNRAKPTVDRAL